MARRHTDATALARPFASPTRTVGRPRSRPGAAPVVIEPVARRIEDDRTASGGAASVLTRYPVGTHSSTIDRIRLTDGREARTDLVRLHPNVDAYSLRITGTSPRHAVGYAVAGWTNAPTLRIWQRRREIDAVLRASYPAVGLRELSRRLRAAGYPMGGADLRDHEAIAATQAALWHLTDGIDLATRPAHQAGSVRVHDGRGSAVPLTTSLTSDRPLFIELTYDARPQLGGYHVAFGAPTDLTRLELTLERSVDGSTWVPVPTSAVPAIGGGRRGPRPVPVTGGSVFSAHSSRVPVRSAVGRITTWRGVTLGLGTTLANRHGDGYPHYRVVLATSSEQPVPITVEDVWVAPSGVSPYPNPERVVHLYDDLLRRARSRPAGGLSLVRTGPGQPPQTPAQRDFGAPSPATALGPLRLRGVTPGDPVRIRTDHSGDVLLTPDGRHLPEEFDAAQEFRIAVSRRRRTPLRLTVECARSLPHTQLLVGTTAPGSRVGDPTPLVRTRVSRRTETATFLLDASSRAIHG